MRQLLTIVTDEHVRYLVSEDGEVQQIAQTINPGLDVPELISFGDVLTSALGLNGTSKRKPVARALDAPETPALPPATSSKPKRQPTPPVAVTGNAKWGANRHAVLDYIRKHPGCTYLDITLGVCKTNDPRAVQSVSAAIGWWRAKGGAHIVSTPCDITDVLGRTRRGSALTLIEPAPDDITRH